MATIQFDPDDLAAAYKWHLSESERYKRIIDVLPDIQSYVAERDGKPPSIPDDRKVEGGALRPVNGEIRALAKEFILAWAGHEFTMADVASWLAKHKADFDPTRDRDAFVTAFRHFVEGEEKLLKIVVPGVGRRVQVYGIIARETAGKGEAA